MNPKINLVTKPQPQNIPLVFFHLEGENLREHSLSSLLNREERDYLNRAAGHLKLKEKEARTLYMPGTGRRVFAVAVSKKSNFSTAKAGLATRVAVQLAKREKVKRFAFWVAPVGNEKNTREFYEVVAVNALMANFEFAKYKSDKKDIHFIEEIQAVASSSVSAAQQNKVIAEGLRRGAVIGEEVNSCRELANTPGGDMTPQKLAEHAKHDARGTGIKVKIFNDKKIKKLKMGGVLGVAQGSSERPRFIIMEYMKGRRGEKPLALVGKGVTFDTGGLNIKGGEGMYEMHMDMSGGAAVMHAIRAAARLKVKKNIVALIPAVENMPSGSSYRPGDVLRTMSGKTIEVLNTDAEGRVILADALHYAKKYKPALVVDAATLTGAAVVALGQRYSGLFTADRNLEEFFRRAGEETGDKVWPMPLTEEYEEDIKGTFGDVANMGKTRYGGAITGAVFLWQFTKEKPERAASESSMQAYPWVHLDIAPRMTATESDHLAKGAAGAPVRLLVRILEEFK